MKKLRDIETIFVVLMLFLGTVIALGQDPIPTIRQNAGPLNHRERKNVNKSINQTNLNKDTAVVLRTALDLKAPLASPTFTGTVTVAVMDSLTFENGAAIDNEDADTLVLTETVVKVTGDLYVTGYSIGLNSCGFAYVSTPGTMIINTGGTFEKLDEGNIAYTEGHLHNFTHDDGRLTYTGTHSLHCTIGASVSLESGETAQEIQLRFAKNGTTIAETNMTRTFVVQSTDTAIPLDWLDEMVTDDYYEVYGTSDTNDDEFDINNLTLTITKH